MPTVVRRVALSLLLICLVAGCSATGRITEDLIKELKNSRAAVNSAILAIDLSDQGRSSAAVTRTELGNGADELLKAEKKVSQLKTATGAQSERRDRVLSAIREATSAVLAARDSAERDEPLGRSRQALTTAARALDQALSMLESTQ